MQKSALTRILNKRCHTRKDCNMECENLGWCKYCWDGYYRFERLVKMLVDIVSGSIVVFLLLGGLWLAVRGLWSMI